MFFDRKRLTLIRDNRPTTASNQHQPKIKILDLTDNPDLDYLDLLPTVEAGIAYPVSFNFYYSLNFNFVVTANGPLSIRANCNATTETIRISVHFEAFVDRWEYFNDLVTSQREICPYQVFHIGYPSNQVTKMIEYFYTGTVMKFTIDEAFEVF